MTARYCVICGAPIESKLLGRKVCNYHASWSYAWQQIKAMFINVFVLQVLLLTLILVSFNQYIPEPTIRTIYSISIALFGVALVRRGRWKR